jgi:hypothetical protein
MRDYQTSVRGPVVTNPRAILRAKADGMNLLQENYRLQARVEQLERYIRTLQERSGLDVGLMPDEAPSLAIACEVCGQEPSNGGVTLFRVNEVGVRGVWRCRAHGGRPADDVTADVVDTIESGKR